MQAARRVALVTGANTGVGLQTALGLARKPFHVILACRSESRGAAAVEWLRRECAEACVSFMRLDLADLNDVARFTDCVSAEYPGGISVVVCNAGIGGTDRKPEQTDDGGDLVYRVNFVAHFVLVHRLLPLLACAAAETKTISRVVTVSSVMHRFGHSRWKESLDYNPSASSYNPSKLALAVFAAEITRRAKRCGVLGIAVNPGAVNSDIWYRGDDSWGSRAHWQRSLLQHVFRRVFLTTTQGAATSISAATAPEWEDCRAEDNPLYLSPYRSPPNRPMPFDLHGPFAGAHRCRPHEAVLDAAEGRALWDGLVGDARVASFLRGSERLR